MSRVTVSLKNLGELLSERGLNQGGRVQEYVDNEVIKRCEPRVPMLTGTLKNSAQAHSVLGSGEVNYVTPYARRQYKENKGKGTRGNEWFEKMKAAEKDKILEGAKKIGGAI